MTVLKDGGNYLSFELVPSYRPDNQLCELNECMYTYTYYHLTHVLQSRVKQAVRSIGLSVYILQQRFRVPCWNHINLTLSPTSANMAATSGKWVWHTILHFLILLTQHISNSTYTVNRAYCGKLSSACLCYTVIIAEYIARIVKH